MRQFKLKRLAAAGFAALIVAAAMAGPASAGLVTDRMASVVAQPTLEATKNVCCNGPDKCVPC
jgi:hypothetical protein